jgi:hypothetical protein
MRLSEMSGDSGLASALKEQLALIAFVVLFAGMISTETYYAAYGIRYQFLGLSVAHLISRGLTSVLDSPILLLTFLSAIAWLGGGARLFATHKQNRAGLVQPVTYALVFAIVVVTYFSAVAAGRNAAEQDLKNTTSRLPVVQAMTDAEGKPLSFGGYRLLTVGQENVAVFKPVASHAESPFIHILKRDAVGEITITR